VTRRIARFLIGFVGAVAGWVIGTNLVGVASAALLVNPSSTGYGVAIIAGTVVGGALGAKIALRYIAPHKANADRAAALPADAANV
jgi:hypothetical protein